MRARHTHPDALSVQAKLTALNLPFTAQFSDFPVWNMIDTYLAAADLPPRAELILPWQSTSTLRYGWE